MTMSTRVPGLGHNAGPLSPVGHPIWPDGTQGLIARRKHPATTSGRARTQQWVLRFERRTPPFIEPLMGWTGGDDTLVHVELTFGSRDEAVRYAEREGLAYRVEGEAMTATGSERQQVRERSEANHRQAAEELHASTTALAWMDARRTSSPRFRSRISPLIESSACLSSSDRRPMRPR